MRLLLLLGLQEFTLQFALFLKDLDKGVLTERVCCLDLVIIFLFILDLGSKIVFVVQKFHRLLELFNRGCFSSQMIGNDRTHQIFIIVCHLLFFLPEI